LALADPLVVEVRDRELEIENARSRTVEGGPESSEPAHEAPLRRDEHARLGLPERSELAGRDAFGDLEMELADRERRPRRGLVRQDLLADLGPPLVERARERVFVVRSEVSGFVVDHDGRSEPIADLAEHLADLAVDARARELGLHDDAREERGRVAA